MELEDSHLDRGLGPQEYFLDPISIDFYVSDCRRLANDEMGAVPIVATGPILPVPLEI